MLTEAIAADACEQRAESDESNQTDAHGDAVVWDDGRGPDVVCECCGSGWAIDQSRLDAPVSDDDLSDALDAEGESDETERELTLAERWPTATAAASVGESTTKTRIRNRVEEELKHCDEMPSVASMLGRNMIDPKYAEFVESVMRGEDNSEPESFRRASLDSEWHLEAIVDRDGEEHAPNGGGVDMAPLKLPVQRILDETRLQHSLGRGEMWRCSKCNFGTYSKRAMARDLVNHGIDNPKHAEHALRVEDYYEHNRECMQYPADRLNCE
ncbi:hypothetical protein [Haloferax sp. ATB1]|uniref:hypothetical protein n=1 Tax=Haloferax sp. ATB1 TaxID=1508454 RepID=UPI000AE5B173|nr:hypothetical protein [Haloferax sp. ATB1]